MTLIKTLLSMLFVLLALATATLFYALHDRYLVRVKKAPIKSGRPPHF